jgi:hypothetical protein
MIFALERVVCFGCVFRSRSFEMRRFDSGSLALALGHHGVEDALLDALGRLGVVEQGPALFADLLLHRFGHRLVRQDLFHERV